MTGVGGVGEGSDRDSKLYRVRSRHFTLLFLRTERCGVTVVCVGRGSRTKDYGKQLFSLLPRHYFTY